MCCQRDWRLITESYKQINLFGSSVLPAGDTSVIPCLVFSLRSQIINVAERLGVKTKVISWFVNSGTQNAIGFSRQEPWKLRGWRGKPETGALESPQFNGPRPKRAINMLIAQITDTHIKSAGRLAYNRIDTARNLAACVDHLMRLPERPDMVLLTGDLTDFGCPEEYAHLRRLLEPLDMPLFPVPGNHDDRGNLRDAFADHDYLKDDDEFLHYAVDGYPLRMIGLDTTIPGKPGGELCAARLAWLDGQLGMAPEKPTILFMHHPPIVTGIQHMDVTNCANAGALGDLVESHPQVFQIVCGHVHRPIHTRWHGVTVTIAPSSSHYVALDTRENGPADWMLEPPAVQLHRWQDGMLISHLSFIGEFEGPHPFYDQDGNLID